MKYTLRQLLAGLLLLLVGFSSVLPAATWVKASCGTNGLHVWQKVASCGGPVVTPVAITVNTANFNLFTFLGNPTAAVNVEVTINAGVYVYSSAANAAFNEGTLPAGSSVKIINNGYIEGYLGPGGGGGYTGGSGAAGAVGGTALSLTVNTAIDNTGGHIYGGGGGGGGGGGYYAITGDPASYAWGGTGGNGQSYFAVAQAGGGSVYTSGGGGGSWGLPGGAGGNGPDYGGGPISYGGAGGAGGKAIALNGFTVTWLGGNNGTQVLGAVQ